MCIGDLNADITIVADSAIAPGSDTQGTVALVAGGSAANVAAVAVSPELDVRFAGVVGDDALGRFLVDDLVTRCIEVCGIDRTGATSRAIAAVIAPNGERSMVSDLSTATVLGIDDVEERWLDHVDWLHLTAYTWFPEGGPEVLERLVDLATARQVPWSLDPSSAQMLQDGRPISDALDAFSGVAVIFPNHDEARVLTGRDDPTAAARSLLDVAETVAVTRGPDGVSVASRHHGVFHAAAHEVELINTLGAGDAFAAGFLAGRLGGETNESSAQRGLAAAAGAVSRATAR